MLPVVVIVVALCYRNEAGGAARLPWFVMIFMVLMGLRNLVPLPEFLFATVNEASPSMLLTAILALGGQDIDGSDVRVRSESVRDDRRGNGAAFADGALIFPLGDGTRPALPTSGLPGRPFKVPSRMSARKAKTPAGCIPWFASGWIRACNVRREGWTAIAVPTPVIQSVPFGAGEKRSGPEL